MGYNGGMQHNFGPPEFLPGQADCPKCRTPVREDEAAVACPLCFTRHHRRCVHEGVACGNEGCDYVFEFSGDAGPPEFEGWDGPERRADSDRRRQDEGPPDGRERRVGPRRRADF